MAQPTATLTRPFGAEPRDFILLVAQWRDLEKSRDVGLPVLAARLAPVVQLVNLPGGLKTYPGGMFGAIAAGMLGSFRVDDVRETLVQGLRGGGLTATEAAALVASVFDDEARIGRGPALHWAPLAFEIIMAALIGVEDEPIDLGESEGATRKPRRRSQTKKPGSRTSTRPGP